MRIVIDGRTIQDHFPGIARYTFHLTRALAEASPDDRFILLHNPAALNSRFSWAEIRARANIRLLPSSAGIFSLRSQWQIPQELNRWRPDLFHATYYTHPYRLRPTIVVTVYDLIPLVCPEHFTLTQRLIFRATMTLSLTAARQVICLSNSTAKDLQRLFTYPSDRISVIPPGTDPTFNPESAKSASSAGSYILYMGSNKPHKNLKTLVEAWAQTKARSSHKLVIAGHWDPRFPGPKRRAEQLGLEGDILFAGQISEKDMQALYAGATLFVFPSLYEGFGYPVLEAMASGTPVICSNTSSLPELVSDAARLIDPTNVAELAAAIDEVLSSEDLRQELRRKGASRAAQFCWSGSARKILSVYRQAAS